jgi:hypothetical protein
MGIEKWLLKNGPGSPGSAAKFFAKYYNKLAAIYSQLHWGDLFEAMHDDRIRTSQMLDPKNKAGGLFQKRDKIWVVHFSQGDICLFTFIMLYIGTEQFRTGIGESLNATSLNLNELKLESKSFDLTLEVIQETALSITPKLVLFNKNEYRKKVLQFMLEF